MAIITGLLLWLLYGAVKHKPQLFAAENLSKSFFTMGILAVALIIIIGLAVIGLKSY